MGRWVLALGQQFVAYGIHPDTQQPYRWPVEELSDIPFAELPIVTEQQVHAFMAAAYERLPPALRTKAPGRIAVARSTTPVAAISAVRGRPRPQPSSISRSAMTAMTLGSSWGSPSKARSAIGGLELWDRWSRQSTKYKPGECARRWAMPSFTPRDVGFGHLFTRASEAGGSRRMVDLLAGAADQLAGLVEHRAQPWLIRIKDEAEASFLIKSNAGRLYEGRLR